MALDDIPWVAVLVPFLLPSHLRKRYLRYKLLYVSVHAPFFFSGILYLVLGVFIATISSYFNLGYLFFLGVVVIGYSIFQFVCGIYDYIRYSVFKKFGNEKIPSEYGDEYSNIDIILKRKSVRGYQRKQLTIAHEKYLKKLIKHAMDKYKVKLLYWKENFDSILVTDSYQHLIIIIPKKYSNYDLVDAGRAVQEIILKLTKRGVGTCWIGGFTNYNVLPIIRGRKDQNGNSFDEKNDHIASLLSMGYESRFVPKLMAESYERSRTRKKLKELFFNGKLDKPIKTDDVDSKTLKLLEATRWAPSASNDQTTHVIRVVGETETRYHFYKLTESIFYGPLNCGISMANFESACGELGIEGKFVKEKPDLKIPKNGEYYYTFVQNN